MRARIGRCQAFHAVGLSKYNGPVQGTRNPNSFTRTAYSHAVQRTLSSSDTRRDTDRQLGQMKRRRSRYSAGRRQGNRTIRVLCQAMSSPVRRPPMMASTSSSVCRSRSSPVNSRS